MKTKNSVRILASLMALFTLLFSCSTLINARDLKEVQTVQTKNEASVDAEKIPNKLLYSADFNKSEKYSPQTLKGRGGETQISTDGKALTLITKKVTGPASIYFGGLLNGLALDATKDYTVSFSLENNSNAKFGIFFDYDGANVDNSTGFTGNGTEFLGVSGGSDNSQNKEIAFADIDSFNGVQKYCAEVEGKGGKINLYASVKGRYKLIGSVKYGSGKAASESLGLVFYLYGGTNPALNRGEELCRVTFSDVAVYENLFKGDVFKTFKPEENGKLLLNIKDLSKMVVNKESGASYVPAVNHVEYSYDAENGYMNTFSKGSSDTCTYGGKTNLLLDETSKYTVVYYARPFDARGSGLRISYESDLNSIGYYNYGGTQGCLAWGDKTSPGYSGYKKYNSSAMLGGTIGIHDGYAMFAIEIDGNTVSLYVNGVRAVKEDITKPSNKGAHQDIAKNYVSDTLSVIWHEYQTNVSKGEVYSQFKDISIYSGLVMTKAYDTSSIGLQVGSVKDGFQSVRFICGAMNESYTKAGIEIKVNFKDKEYSYIYGTRTAYRKLSAIEGLGIEAFSAPEESANYLFAYTLNKIPADRGVITYEVTPFIVDNGLTLRGETTLYTVENGIIK